MKKLFIIICIGIAFCCKADTIVTLDGKKYEYCKIIKLMHDGVLIVHIAGRATIPWDKLPVELQQKFAKKIKQLKDDEKNRQEQKKIFCLKSLCGYALGEKFDKKDSKNDKKFEENSFVCKIKANDFLEYAKRHPKDLTQVEVYVTKEHIIYKIKVLFAGERKLKKTAPNFPNIRTDDKSFLRQWACENYLIKLPLKQIVRKKIKKNNREMRLFSAIEYSNEEISFLDSIEITDIALLPLKEKIFRDVISEKDEMQRTTWYKPEIKAKSIEHDDNSFEIFPYVGKTDDGSIFFRIYTRYSGDKWIFYQKIQIMDQDGNDFAIIIPLQSKKTEVGKNAIVHEWADVLIQEKDFIKIKNAKTLRFKFYGKYSPEFYLTERHVKNFNSMINLYKYLQNDKI